MKPIYKMSLIVILVSTLLISGVIGWSNQRFSKIVELGNQQQEIEDVLAMKSIKKVESFRGIHWLKDGRILGVINQPITNNDKTPAQMVIYNPKTEKSEVILTANMGERIGIGELSNNEESVLYSQLLKGNFIENRYHYGIVQLKTKKTISLSKEMTAAHKVPNQDLIFVASGMTIDAFTFDGNKKSIPVSQELIKALSDFSRFSFSDYKQEYYSDLKDPKEIEKVKKNYENDVRYNAINRLYLEGDTLILASRNQQYFELNLKSGKYKAIPVDVFSAYFPYSSDIEGKKVILETGDENVRHLWLIDEKGNKRKQIAEGELLAFVREAPDQSKVSFTQIDQSGRRQSYVYDYETGKKLKLFSESVGWASWSPDSTQFFIEIANGSTVVVTLNHNEEVVK